MFDYKEEVMKIAVFYDHILEACKQSGKAEKQVLKELKEAGITEIECSIEHLKVKGTKLRAFLEEEGFEITSIYGIYDLGKNPDGNCAYELVDMAVRMKAKKVLIIPGFLPRNFEHVEEKVKDMLFENMLHGVENLCAYAKGRGITVTMEEYDDYVAPYSTSIGLLTFLERVPLLGCTFDTGNFLYQGEDSLDVLDQFLPRIVHVHCKDRNLNKVDGQWPKLTIEGKPMYACAVGKGSIRMHDILLKLREAGYDNTVSIEHFGSKQQLEDMIESAGWLRRELHDTCNNLE